MGHSIYYVQPLIEGVGILRGRGVTRANFWVGRLVSFFDLWTKWSFFHGGIESALWSSLFRKGKFNWGGASFKWNSPIPKRLTQYKFLQYLIFCRILFSSSVGLDNSSYWQADAIIISYLKSVNISIRYLHYLAKWDSMQTLQNRWPHGLVWTASFSGSVHIGQTQ